VNPAYAAELAGLGATYDAALATSSAAPGAGTAAFVASGGSLAVAHAGAALHQGTGRGLACVMTPMELAGVPVRPDHVVVVSDQLGHPDAHASIALGLDRGAEVFVVTTRTSAELPDGARVLRCRRPGRDGYVATSAVLAMTVGLVRAYLPDVILPPFADLSAPWLDARGALHARHAVPAHDIVCAYAPGLRNVAVDLETRNGEAGFDRVAVVDLRGLGHGRHVGLARTAATSAALLLCDEASAPLATTTAAALPPGLPRVVWGAERPWPVSMVELLLPSFALLGARAAAAGADPGNPEVGPSGEWLFRLGFEAAR
jgi:hypothetical protein